MIEEKKKQRETSQDERVCKEARQAHVDEMKEKIRPYRSRILWIAAGIVVAILMLTIGFWRTLLIVLLAAIGYLIGTRRDNPQKFYSWIGKAEAFRGR